MLFTTLGFPIFTWAWWDSRWCFLADFQLASTTCEVKDAFRKLDFPLDIPSVNLQMIFCGKMWQIFFSTFMLMILTYFGYLNLDLQLIWWLIFLDFILGTILFTKACISHTKYLCHTFYTPRTTKLLGGILVSLRPSVRPSVCPSVRPSCLPCPLCNMYSSG